MQEPREKRPSSSTCCLGWFWHGAGAESWTSSEGGWRRLEQDTPHPDPHPTLPKTSGQKKPLMLLP